MTSATERENDIDQEKRSESGFVVSEQGLFVLSAIRDTERVGKRKASRSRIKLILLEFFARISLSISSLKLNHDEY